MRRRSDTRTPAKRPPRSRARVRRRVASARPLDDSDDGEQRDDMSTIAAGGAPQDQAGE